MLEALVARPSAPAGVVRRARVILLSAAGVGGVEIATRLALSAEAVSRIRRRFRRDGVDGLEDRPKAGRHDHAVPVETVEKIVQLALSPPPAGRSRWTTRLLAQAVGPHQWLHLRHSPRAGSEAASRAHLQSEPRSGLCRQGHRRRRALPASARTRDCTQCRREDVHSGAATDSTATPAPHRPRGPAPARLSATRRHRFVCGPGGRDGQRDPPVQSHPHRHGLPPVHEEGRAHLPRPHPPCGARQLVHARHRRRARMARRPPADPLPLHAHECVLAEPNRGLLWHLDQAVPRGDGLSVGASAAGSPRRLSPGVDRNPTPFEWTKPARALIRSHKRMLDRISTAVH